MPRTDLFEFIEFGIMAQADGIGTLPWAFGGRWVWVDFLLHGKTPLICYMEANLAFLLLRQQHSMFQSLVKLSVLCS